MKRQVGILILLFLSVSIFISGCGEERIRVQIPPIAPVENIKTIAVLPFDNYTGDPSLAYDIERNIIQKIINSGWYEMVDHQRVINILNQYGYSTNRLSPDAVQNIQSKLEVDAIIIGTAATYFEDVYMNPPICYNCDKPGSQFYWSATQNTYIMVEFDAQMIEVATGKIIHMMRASGDAWNFRSVDILDHNSREIVPTAPPTNRQQVPVTRNAAIDEAVDVFVADILPTYEWRTIDQVPTYLR